MTTEAKFNVIDSVDLDWTFNKRYHDYVEPKYPSKKGHFISLVCLSPAVVEGETIVTPASLVEVTADTWSAIRRGYRLLGLIAPSIEEGRILP